VLFLPNDRTNQPARNRASVTRTMIRWNTFRQFRRWIHANPDSMLSNPACPLRRMPGASSTRQLLTDRISEAPGSQGSGRASAAHTGPAPPPLYLPRVLQLGDDPGEPPDAQELPPERPPEGRLAWQPPASPPGRARLHQVHSAASDAQMISLSLRAKMHLSAKAGWLQSTSRPWAVFVGGSSLQRSISS
jgi:hypothetical protein